MSLQVKLQAESVAYQKIQSEHSLLVEARQRLDAQLSENELVKKEFDQLTSDNVVYKQIGPALVLQDQFEAKSNVETRLEFIRGEIKRIEVQLKDTELRAESKKQELVDIQTALQQQQIQQEPIAPNPSAITST
ncbi:prefoldin subunit 6 [Infundibulicybe gibba]|nr:prefoldin subunit 6 [Infundibulicybe gibba]